MVTAERSFHVVTGNYERGPMPVTTRLLQKLHDALGDEATDDLLAWREEAATVNRATVREVADLYFQRFEALLDKGLAETRAHFDRELSEVRAHSERGLAETRAHSDQGLAEGRAYSDRGLAAVRAEIAGLRTDMANQRADLLKWMFIFWAGTVIPLAGLAIALTKL